LIEGAELMEKRDAQAANYLRDTADTWNENIERWTYAIGTPLARQCEVDGYYVRITPPRDDGGLPLDGVISITNHPEKLCEPAANIVSLDALALVNYGLRAADDPRMTNTVRVIDALLKIETPHGPCWHRYNHDGYGEQPDGAPFVKSGIGRAWPLLTGERAHYEVAAGRKDEAERLLHAMEGFAGNSGLIPEQIWDAPDVPERDLFFGRPTGSATPLVWAHAEYIKLCRSLRDGEVYGMSRSTAQRYVKKKKCADFGAWRFSDRIQSLPREKNLRIEVLAIALVRWSINGWETWHDCETVDSRLGVHHVDLSAGDLAQGTEIIFTFHWRESKTWEGKNFRISLG
jgi:glucoamylase